MTGTAPRLSRAELRELFLFTDLTDTQLDWIREHGETVEVGDGEIVTSEGEQSPGTRSRSSAPTNAESTSEPPSSTSATR